MTASTVYTLADLNAMKTYPGGGGGYASGGYLPVGTISDNFNITYTGGPSGSWEPAESEPIPEVVKCHCGRDWHTAPLRQRVAAMLRGHYFDPNYKAAEDDSPIVCVGSKTYGPNRGPHEYASGWFIAPSGTWITGLISETIVYATNAIWNITGGTSWQQLPDIEWPTVTMNTWFPQHPNPEPCADIPELDIKLGPENWAVQPSNAMFSERHFADTAAAKIHPDEWREPIALPERSVLDVSALADEFNKKHNWNGVNK